MPPEVKHHISKDRTQRLERTNGILRQQTVKFPTNACDACPLKAQCTTSKSGRSVSIHPDEPLLEELRQRQATPQGRAQLRQRVAVEHSLAHVGHWHPHLSSRWLD